MNRLIKILLLGFMLIAAGCVSHEEKIHQPVSIVNHPLWSVNKTVYQLSIQYYTEEGTFKALVDHLPRLKDLGVGIIWLMPVQPAQENDRMFAVKDYRRFDPQYGTPQDFKNLVAKIHELSMFVILDWPAFYGSEENNLLKTNPDFFDRTTKEIITLNYQNTELREYMLESLKYWIQEYDIDGFNCASVENIPTGFWDKARHELETLKPVFMLAEGEAAFLHNKAFDMTYSRGFYNLANKLAKGKGPLKKLDEILEEEKRIYPWQAYRMRYTDVYFENKRDGSAIDRLGEAAKTLAVLAATIPGKPMVFNGQEYGLAKVESKRNWQESGFYAFYKKLLNLYQNNPALHRGKMIKLSDDNEAQVYAFARIADTFKVVVVLNLSAQQKSIGINSDLLAGSYRELFSGNPLTFSGSRCFDLEPWAYRVFVKNGTAW